MLQTCQFHSNWCYYTDVGPKHAFQLFGPVTMKLAGLEHLVTMQLAGLEHLVTMQLAGLEHLATMQLAGLEHLATM